MISARNEKMLMVKKIIAIALCVLAELSIGFQLRHPRVCMGTFSIWKAIHKITGAPMASWIVVLVVMLFAIAGIALLGFSVWTDNKKGTLKYAYISLLINAALLLIGTIASYGLYRISEKTKGIEISVIVLAVASLIYAVVLFAFIQRETKGEMISYTIHLALLVVIMGVFVSSGMFGYAGLTKVQGAVRGLIVMIPYLTVFVIENFMLSPFEVGELNK